VLVFIEPFSANPMPSTNAKYKPRISQSIPVILNGSFHPPALIFRWGTPFSQKAAFTKDGAYMTREAAASVCPSAGPLRFGLRFFGLTTELVPFYVL
jgi:hypothetical protein